MHILCTFFPVWLSLSFTSVSFPSSHLLHLQFQYPKHRSRKRNRHTHEREEKKTQKNEAIDVEWRVEYTSPDHHPIGWFTATTYLYFFHGIAFCFVWFLVFDHADEFLYSSRFLGDFLRIYLYLLLLLLFSAVYC